jgi:hypothetical protein
MVEFNTNDEQYDFKVFMLVESWARPAVNFSNNKAPVFNDYPDKLMKTVKL